MTITIKVIMQIPTKIIMNFYEKNPRQKIIVVGFILELNINVNFASYYSLSNM